MVRQNTSHRDVHGQVCPLSYPVNETNARIESDSQGFDWSPTTQGMILGSFWWTYMTMQIPSGRMAELFGGKKIVAISLIGSGIINMFTPLASHSLFLLIMTRMALGLVQGGIFPSCYALVGKWFPLNERSLGFAFMEIGATIGSVLATTIGGYLSEHGFAGGWPSVFYVSGLLALIAFFLWESNVESNPSSYPGISSHELTYISGGQGMSMEATSASTLEASGTSTETVMDSMTSRPSVPWKEIATSPPVLAVICSKFCGGWTYFTLLSKLPAYLHDALHVPPTQVCVKMIAECN